MRTRCLVCLKRAFLCLSPNIKPGEVEIRTAQPPDLLRSLKRVFLCLRLTIKILQINAALCAKSFCAAPPKKRPGWEPGAFHT